MYIYRRTTFNSRKTRRKRIIEIWLNAQKILYIIVPDRRCRIIPEVVLVRRWAVGVLGVWRGEGLGKGWNKGGQFTSNLRPRWTDPVTARRVPSK